MLPYLIAFGGFVLIIIGGLMSFKALSLAFVPPEDLSEDDWRVIESPVAQWGEAIAVAGSILSVIGASLALIQTFQ